MIRTTLEHPLGPVGREWTRAGELGIGELLVTLSGVPIAVEAIRSTGEVATVYNLEVEEHHTYFVTGDGWGLAVWAHNATCSFAKGGFGQDEMVDAVGYEIQAAATRAEKLLASGGHGNTAWGKIYQRVKGVKGLGWFEKMAYGSAIQQIADDSLVFNSVLRTAKVEMNVGGLLGLRRNGNLLRPDYQMRVAGGGHAVFDISSVGQAGKIAKYAPAGGPNVPYLVNILY